MSDPAPSRRVDPEPLTTALVSGIMSFGLIRLGIKEGRLLPGVLGVVLLVVGINAAVRLVVRAVKARGRSVSDGIDRQVSLKELFGIVTYFAIAVAFEQAGRGRAIGHISVDMILFFGGTAMLVLGIGGVVGFIFRGRAGIAAGVYVTLFVVPVSFLSMEFLEWPQWLVEWVQWWEPAELK